MTYHVMPRIKLWTNNSILRPSQAAERKSRKVGTSKRVAASMAARLVRRLACQETGLSMPS